MKKAKNITLGPVVVKHAQSKNAYWEMSVHGAKGVKSLTLKCSEWPDLLTAQAEMRKRADDLEESKTNPSIRETTLAGRVLKIIALDKIDDNPVQPPVRLKRSKDLAELMEDISAYGGIREPLRVTTKGAANGRYVLCSGHRRSYCLRELGHTEAPCEVTNEDPIVSMLGGDKGKKRISSQNSFYVWAAAAEAKREAVLQSMPQEHAKSIRRFVKITGKSEAIDYGMREVSPDSSRYPHQIYDLINSMTREQHQPELKKILRWIIKRNARRPVLKFLNDLKAGHAGGSKTGKAAKVARIIEQDLPWMVP